jgi:hypothetical protein
MLHVVEWSMAALTLISLHAQLFLPIIRAKKTWTPALLGLLRCIEWLLQGMCEAVPFASAHGRPEGSSHPSFHHLRSLVVRAGQIPLWQTLCRTKVAFSLTDKAEGRLLCRLGKSYIVGLFHLCRPLIYAFVFFLQLCDVKPILKDLNVTRKS